MYTASKDEILASGNYIYIYFLLPEQPKPT
jgi:hypothetical protein